MSYIPVPIGQENNVSPNNVANVLSDTFLFLKNDSNYFFVPHVKETKSSNTSHSAKKGIVRQSHFQKSETFVPLNTVNTANTANHNISKQYMTHNLTVSTQQTYANSRKYKQTHCTKIVQIINTATPRINDETYVNDKTKVYKLDKWNIIPGIVPEAKIT